MKLDSDVLAGLSRPAALFVRNHGIRIPIEPIERLRTPWLEAGIPVEQIDRVVDFDRRWGGLVLPPAPEYEGGPDYLHGDLPERMDNGNWTIGAGVPRVSVPYAFSVGPDGEFGIEMDQWVPLHASVEGWVESLALTHHASMFARQITVVKNDEVDALAWEKYEPVAEVAGLADSWWRGQNSFVALYTGEGQGGGTPEVRKARIYTGLSDQATRWS